MNEQAYEITYADLDVKHSHMPKSLQYDSSELRGLNFGLSFPLNLYFVHVSSECSPELSLLYIAINTKI